MSDVLTLKAPFVGNDGRPLIEPGAFFLDGNYALRINSWNALAGVVVTVRARIIRASDGELVDSSWDHTPNTNRTKATNDFPLPAGFILNVTAFASAGSPLVGQTFVQVQLARGLSGATLLLGTLLQDYVTSVQALAYPGSPIRSSVDGGGYIRSITGAAPGAGVEILETVPAGARWELLTGACVLTTSATAGTRIVGLLIRTAGVTRAATFQPTGLIPSRIGVWYFGQAMPNMTDPTGNQNTLPLPRSTMLLAADTWGTQTQAIAAGDQWNAPQYTVRELLEAAA